MLYYSKGGITEDLHLNDLRSGLFEALGQIGAKQSVLAIPPDHTRLHSRAGDLTRFTYEYYKDKLKDILPALGTHAPMKEHELEMMYGNLPRHLFKVHQWRKDLISLGEVPGDFVAEVSEGKLNYAWPAQVNKLLVEGGHDLILSFGQVVPHEVVGMANYNKNIFIGTGGREGINKSHFLGAVYGMERMMGRINTPVRKVLNYAGKHFASHLPIVYVLTVVALDANGALKTRGLFIGDDDECFQQAASLSLQVNFDILEKPLQKVVVYLDPNEFKSTWLGNKAIYRTRMAVADGGELIILAPGLKQFGEDDRIDALVRKYGYTHTPEILENVRKNKDLQENLSAAAHLIHGSSEGRFKITYCPGYIKESEIRSVNFNYASLNEMLKIYHPDLLKEGTNRIAGEEIFYISNPALGLWASREKFGE
jgi:nickel-dependent lactate racemase